MSRALLHRLDFLGADEALGLVVQWRVDGEDIDPRQHLLRRADQLDTQLLRPRGGDERVVADDLHLHSHRPRRDGLADPPQADDAQRLAGQLRTHELLAVPAALDKALVGRGDVPHQAVHQGQRLLGGGDRVSAGRVHHHNPLAGGGRSVDIVNADAGTGDGLQAAVARQRIGGDLHAAAADRAVEFGQGRFEPIPFEPGADLDLDAGGRPQQVQAVFGKFIQNDNVCHDVLLKERNYCSGKTPAR